MAAIPHTAAMASNPALPPLVEGIRILPPAQKLGLLVALAAAASLVAAWWLYSQTPDWRVLYASVAERDGGAVVGALAQANIPHKMSDSGAVLVPSDKVNEARMKLASQGLPKGGSVGFELLDGQKLGATQFQEQVAYQRALEGELARSIQALAAVSGARVHLAIPRSSSFLREAQKPSASVLVNLYPGKSLERAHVAGIVHLVASSIPDMPAKNVSVVDQNGTLLSSPAQEGAGGGLDATQLAWVQQVETGLAHRVEEILEPMVGRGNVRAQITAEVDFSVTESTAETYKPNGVQPDATVRSQTMLEQNGGAGAAAAGIPGAASNQPAAKPAAAATTGTTPQGRRESTTQYEVDRTVKRTRQPTGSVKRLSAAVVVNHRKKVDEEGKATFEPLGAEELKQIEALVKEAMGFSQPRGDSLNVAHAAFAVTPEAPVTATPLWQDPAVIATVKEYGKHGLVVALVLYLLMGVVRPVLRNIASAGTAAASARAELDVTPGAAALAAPEDPVMAVRQLAKQDPARVAHVVKGWVSNE